MKIRSGLVSNSSSSNFLIVGITRGSKVFADLTNKIFAELPSEHWYDSQGYFNTPKGCPFSILGCRDPNYIGINPESYLNKNYTLDEIRDIVIKAGFRYGVEIPRKDINIHYGEVGN